MEEDLTKALEILKKDIEEQKKARINYRIHNDVNFCSILLFFYQKFRNNMNIKVDDVAHFRLCTKGSAYSLLNYLEILGLIRKIKFKRHIEFVENEHALDEYIEQVKKKLTENKVISDAPTE